MAWDTGLTGVALNIASATATPLRVLAGPGTGKSFSLMRRVARLLSEGVAPNRILAVTFTRTAAGDLVRELASLGAAGADKVHASTLHSLCFGLLARDDVFAVTQRFPRPLLTFKKSGVLQFEAAPMLRDLQGSFGDQRDRTKRVLAFEAAWARRQDQIPGPAIDPIDQQFQSELESWLQFHGAILVGELVPLALRYVANNPAAPILKDYAHIIVDEYQDLNKAEQDLLDLISASGTLSLVGDEDQSIYRFRHANPEGIAQFHITHPGTHDESLLECRRCPKKVVAIADALIRRNHSAGTAARLMPTPSNPDGTVRVVQWADSDQEIAGLGSYVTSLITNGTEPGDILILSPRQLLGNAIRDEIRSKGIAAHSYYSEEALKEHEAQVAFSLLTLAGNPDDRIAYRFLLGCESSSHLSAQYLKVVTLCKASGDSPRQHLAKVAAGTQPATGIGDVLSRHQWIEGRIASALALTGQALIESLFPASADWATGLRDSCDRIALDAMPVNQISKELRTRIGQVDVPEEPSVRIMSLHKSKGLSSPVVIVSSCVDGLIPFRDDDATPTEANEIHAEQRRLFYVALTRSRSTLVLSSFRGIAAALVHKLGVRASFRPFGPRPAHASPFLSELGPTAPEPLLGATWKASGFL